MSEEIPYIRVGTSYYKTIEKPLISGDRTSVLVKWNRETIVGDYGKTYVSHVPKYDGFCCIPDHINFKQIVNGFYNVYSKIPYEPSITKDFKNKLQFTNQFMRHIFGEQIDLGFDYLKILLEQPTQILPILCLVSKERATGKSTFIKWLKEIFGSNMTYIKGDSFSSQFNADWAAKLIVAIDEVFFDRKEITERLKYLSTTNKDKLEAKGKDREEIEVFAKYILCSNDEDTFIKIDENEIRFWVLKIRSIKNEHTEFLQNLISEIPDLLSFLIQRSFTAQKTTRMWFAPNQIRTRALQRLIWKNNNKLESRMIELFYELFDSFEVTEIQVVPQDVLGMLNRMFKNSFWVINDVRKVLKDTWKLEPEKNSLSYVKYDMDYGGDFYQQNKVGRYFLIKRNFILEKFDELMR